MTTRNALLLIAHGSRRNESNEEIRSLTARVRACAAQRFSFVDCAFLELADPPIVDGVGALVTRGAGSIVVLPYFLARGAHVANDIPEAIDAARARYPDVDIVMSRYLGELATMPELLVELATMPVG